MKKSLLIISLLVTFQSISAEGIMPSFDFDKAIQQQKQDENWIDKRGLSKYDLDLKEDMKGFYIYNIKTQEKYRLDGLTVDFQGEKTFNGIRLKREFIDLYFNFDDLIKAGLVK